MAVGFPTKVNYLTGDVLTATNMNDLSGTVNLLTSSQYAAGKNALINGNFEIWQRGTSSTTLGYSTADRWYVNNNTGTSTMSQSTTYLAPDARYSLKIIPSVAANVTSVTQTLETNNSIQFAGQNVTLSAYCAADSSTPMQLFCRYSTSVDVASAGVWTTITATSGGTGTVSTAMTRISGVYAIPSTAQSMQIAIAPVSNMAIGVAAYYGSVQLELGTTVSVFTRNASSFQAELAACQRYYYRQTSITNYGQFASYTPASTTTTIYGQIQPAVTMRIAPTSVEFSTLRVNDAFAGNPAVTAVTIGETANGFTNITITSSTLTQGRVYKLEANNSASAYIGLNAEL